MKPVRASFTSSFFAVFSQFFCYSMQSEAGKPVLVAGDPERAHIQRVKVDGGIHYHINLLQALVN